MSIELIKEICKNGAQYTGHVDKTNKHNLDSITRFNRILELVESLEKPKPFKPDIIEEAPKKTRGRPKRA